MSRYPGAKEFLLKSAEKSTDLKYANRIASVAGPVKKVRKATSEVARKVEGVENLVGTNDDVPPLPAQNVSAEPFSRSLTVKWDAPPERDYVESAEIVYTRLDTGSSRTLETTDRLAILTGLDLAEYEIVVRLRDRWGLVSDPSDPVTESPEPSVADQISDEVEIDAENISGVLGEDKIGEIRDPAKLVEATLAAIKNASGGDYGDSWSKVVGAELLGAWTIAAGRAILANATVNTLLVADAAISTAKIDNLAVTTGKVQSLVIDKLLGGILRAEIEVSSQGMIRSPGVSLGDGIELLDTNIGIGQPGQDTGSGITNRGGKFARLGYFSTAAFPDGPGRGASLVVNGAGSFDGRIELYATRSGRSFSHPTSALISMIASSSGTGRVQISNRLEVLGDGVVNGSVILGGSSRLRPSSEVVVNCPGGSSTTFNHPANGYAAFVSTQFFSGGWRPFVHGTSNFAVRHNQDGSVTISNNSSITYSVRVCFFG